MIEAPIKRTTAQFPVKLKPLFTASRYKVIVGGRGKGASWGIARALLLLGANKPLRILCCREIQNSIKESVYQLLKDQIEILGLHDDYDVLKTEIIGKKHETRFIFTGLQEHTVDSIKSYESVDVAWIAEGQSIKKASWRILIPTIRKEKSEIWVDMNPEMDTDDTYVRFIQNTPPDCQIIHMSYRDNPFFPDTLEKERVHCLKTETKDEYENIWEGKPRATVAGAIFAGEVARLLQEQRYTFCPYDPLLKVHTFWDMGWNDAMAILLVQKRLSECRVIQYFEGSFKRVDEWAALLNQLNYNWGFDHLPPDGYNHERKTGKSDADILKAMGRKVREKGLSFPEDDREVSIRATRNLFPKIILNKGDVNEDYGGMSRLLECMKRYKRTVNKATNEPQGALHDEYSHACAALAGVALCIEGLTNDQETWMPPAQPFTPSHPAMGPLGISAALMILSSMVMAWL